MEILFCWSVYLIVFDFDFWGVLVVLYCCECGFLLVDVGCCCVFDDLGCGLSLIAGLFRLNYWFANSVGLMVPIYFGFCFKVIELVVLFIVNVSVCFSLVAFMLLPVLCVSLLVCFSGCLGLCFFDVLFLLCFFVVCFLFCDFVVLVCWFYFWLLMLVLEFCVVLIVGFVSLLVICCSLFVWFDVVFTWFVYWFAVRFVFDCSIAFVLLIVVC